MTASSSTGIRAVVIGGGIAGLVAARVLSEHAVEVTLLEQDDLADGPAPRRGVPQGRHVHVLLLHGFELLEGLFPGLSADLGQAGTPRINLTRDLVYCGPFGASPRFESDLVLPLPSRVVLEWAVRRRVQAIANVTIRTGIKVTGLSGDVRRSTIRGLHAEQGPVQVARGHVRSPVLQRSGEAADKLTLEADLVVDASGRGSRAPEWLAALGFAAPAETQVRSTLAYATRWYRSAPDLSRSWRAVAILPSPPHDLRAGLVNPVENDEFTVTLSGVAPDRPPTDDEGFLAFARGLRSPEVSSFIERAEPVSPIHTFRQMGNRLRHYERLDPAPGGFVVLGDAFCALNPVYGQGMTVAAMGASALGEQIRDRAAGGGEIFSRAFSARFQRRLARTVRLPWLSATSQDHTLPGTEGERPDRVMQLLHPYMNEFLRLVAADGRAYRDFLRIVHMVAPPFTVLQPRYLLRILPRLAASARRA
jgi:2-polyprenyl-6-methoxyphenol hydroxylase-like FAD-dependent oxidoreductase